MYLRYMSDKLSSVLSNCSTGDKLTELSILLVKLQNAPECKIYKSIDVSIFYLGHYMAKNTLDFNPGWGLRLFMIKKEKQ